MRLTADYIRVAALDWHGVSKDLERALSFHGMPEARVVISPFEVPGYFSIINGPTPGERIKIHITFDGLSPTEANLSTPELSTMLKLTEQKLREVGYEVHEDIEARFQTSGVAWASPIGKAPPRSESREPYWFSGV